MSRWDALKPSNSQRSRQQPPERDVVVPLVSKQTAVHRRDIGSINSQFTSLLRACHSEGSNECTIESLAFFLQNSHNVLPPASVATDAIQAVFLPMLDRPIHESYSRSRKKVLGLIDDLLNDKSFASFLMAPIVESVTVEGREQQVANPVRVQLFDTLQKQLVDSVSTMEIESSCRVLVTALQAAKSVDGTEHHAGQSKTDVEASRVQGFVTRALSAQDPRKTVAALQLLRAFLDRHPDAASSLASHLLLREMGTNPSGLSGESSFLQLLDAPLDVARLAMECLVQTLSNLPLQLWLSDHSSHDNRPALRTIRRSSTMFQNRLIHAVRDVLRIAANWLNRSELERCGVRVPYRSLLGILLTEIPLGQDIILEDAARVLIDKLTSRLLDDSTTPRTSECIRDVLVDASGGRVTPQGTVTHMCSPLQQWLLCNPGFVTLFIGRIQQSSPTRTCSDMCKVLNAMVRSCSLLVLGNKESWTAFSQLLLSWSRSHSEMEQVMASQLMENLFRGKRDCAATLNAAVSQPDLIVFTYPILRDALVCTGAAARSSSCAAFSCWSHVDWREVPDSENSISECLLLMISLSSDCSLNAKHRSDVCRSIGDVCTSFLSITSVSSVLHIKAMLSRVCTVFTDSMKDGNPSVRCMALFAAGNLVQALQRTKSSTIVIPDELAILMRQTFDCLDDADDKVLGNAIRSVGHVTCLTLDYEYRQLFKSSLLDCNAFCESVVHTLLDRIVRALSVTHNGTIMSWKQRSAVKRQGWGACNSFAALFLAGLANDESKREVVSTVVSCLLDCATSMLHVHEKIALSAMAALRSIDTADLFHLKGRSGEVGKTVVACYSWVCDTSFRNRSQRLVEGLESFLVHLLHCLSLVDAQFVLESGKLSPSELVSLCDWMKSKQCPVESFASFALALQAPGMIADIQVEQRFCIQAIGQCSENEDEL